MDTILERIKKIEALIESTKSEGEKKAAKHAKERILNKYHELEREANAKEFALYCPDLWHKKLLLALCRKHGVRPYRYKRQKHTTVMVKINEQFLNQVLYKEFEEYAKHLERLVEKVTDDLIQRIHDPGSEEVI